MFGRVLYVPRRWFRRGSKDAPGRRVVFALVMLCVGMAAIPSSLFVEAGPRREPLAIMTASGSHAFWVEVARTGPVQERGLMFRTSIPSDHGMLFVFRQEGPIRMWMKNTYLPLNMIFVSKQGKVIGIHENAEPLSEKVISSGEAAFSVLEVNGGTAARTGLRRGDVVRHSAFSESPFPEPKIIADE